ncbi:RNA-directed DNA polymerase, eukaryota, reverse transcriptase zinc-binding domain protein [Tanacetum coccineum]|uniref:RNA-directed DNA polymerase, eukaryota, reverse transcriptase zinc-binding domain protein n=1 Tax=Tanacetum coccineum TaxID=301880 RepID=A0ABQ4X155_9ASTR
MLIYAGRLQLIASVLSSIHVYWASVFMLPKIVINDIDKIMKGFLWNQCELKKGTAKVSWKMVCRPKSQGGLGLKDMSIWNETLMSKHLWNIANNKESLWVKGDILSDDDIKRANLDLNIKICDMIEDDKWKWPREWSSKFAEIASIPVPKLNPNTPDTTFWVTNKGTKGNFSTSKVWNDLRGHNDDVKWWNIVWFNHCIPRHAFILWLAIQGRLTTQDRLLKCYESDPSKSKHSCLDLAATVYCIWNERTKRLFAQEVKDWDAVLKDIISTVRFKLASVKVKSSKQLISIGEIWRIKFNTQSNEEIILEE